jgi:DNA topoisomerase-3
VAHHAVIPNANVLDDLEPRLGRLSDDEKRLFALICRSYLVAVMPDYEYRQTVATINVPVPGGPAAEFRATGRIPLRLWTSISAVSTPTPTIRASSRTMAWARSQAAALIVSDERPRSP